MLSSLSETLCRMRIPLIIGLMALASLSAPSVQARDLAPRPAPAFTHRDSSEWLNSPPLTLEQLRGQVVMIDFWTFGCWNCYRSFPWLNALDRRYAPQGLTIVGVHAPEFDYEKDKARLKAKIEEYGLHHPVMVDNDFSYWKAMGNRFWPAFYLLDKQGRIRASFVGETHAGDAQAQAIEAAVERLLAEPAE